MSPLHVLPTLPLILKVNETFALFSALGQIAGNRTVLTNNDDTQTQHPFHGAEGIYREETRYLEEYQWKWPGFYLVNQELKESHILLQQWAWTDDLIQRVGLSRTLELFEDGIEDELSFENTGFSEESFVVQLYVREGFQDVLSVRGWRSMSSPRALQREESELGCTFSYTGSDGVVLKLSLSWNQTQDEGQLPEAGFWRVRLEPQSHWKLCIKIKLGQLPASDMAGSKHVKQKFIPKISEHAFPEPKSWLSRFDELNVDILNKRVWEQNIEDLRMLLLRTPYGFYPAAGLPWYAVPFARDGLWVAHMLMPFALDISESVLRFLASYQGLQYDKVSEEEKGKITHHLRKGELSRAGILPFLKYYASVDSTPLFIIILENYCQFRNDWSLMKELKPVWEKSLQWIQKAQHADTGMLTFSPSGSGLAMHSWKESGDLLTHVDGQPAHPPLAVSEVQGYAFRAFKAASSFYEILGETEKFKEFQKRTGLFGKNFHELFWMEDRQTYALALDSNAQQLEVLSSDPGHLLWSGIVPQENAPALVETMFSKELWSGWGIRTLGTREARYNPVSQFNGAVWSHDTAILAGGLAHYGFHDKVEIIHESLFTLARNQPDGRMPQIIGGHDRNQFQPMPFPHACRPQAWSAASLVYLERLTQKKDHSIC